MRMAFGEMFAACEDGDAVCVTTNGVITKAGKLVMGAGVAKTFRDSFEGIDTLLGEYVSKYGNRVFRIGKRTLPNTNISVTLFSFPTKNDWKDKSDLALIEKSCIELKEVVSKFKISGNIYIPAPGCGIGGLDWLREVKPIVEKHLTEDKYIICFR